MEAKDEITLPSQGESKQRDSDRQASDDLRGTSATDKTTQGLRIIRGKTVFLHPAHLQIKESALANLTAEELEQYNRTMTTERDIRNQIKYAQEQGFEAGKAEGVEIGIERGIEQGKLETIKQFKAAGVTLETIAACTGLDIETVKAL